MSGRLTMCLGLPGSGKSYWAAQQKDVVVVCKDDIREELFKKDWNYDKEKEVLRVRDFRICEALSKGKHVISADTNLAPKHKARLSGLATKYKADFEVKSFLDVPLETCIARDKGREGDPDTHMVGERVIRDMYDQYLAPKPKTFADLPRKDYPKPSTYVPPEGKPNAIIVDLDGTLAIHNGRGPYDTARCGEDLINESVKWIVWLAYHSGAVVLYVSGREEKFRTLSYDWLMDKNCPDGPLHMRPTSDTRNDAIVKLEIFNDYIRDNYNVMFVLDDRDRVVKMWREMGLTCLQVAYGDF